MVFQVNYGRRFFSNNKVALYGEINFLASSLRDVSSSVPTATHDFSSLCLTSGIRVKFLPASRVSPYLVGGCADYEQSTTLINGQPNLASRKLARGVFDFGAGLDVRIWLFNALRGEARDYYRHARLECRDDFRRAAEYSRHGRVRAKVPLRIPA